MLTKIKNALRAIREFHKRPDGRLTKWQAEHLIECRQRLVAALTADQIDVDLHLLESLFGILEEMDYRDRLVILNAGDLIKLPGDKAGKLLVFGGMKP